MSNNDKPKIPMKWGVSAAKFYADREGEPIIVHLVDGGDLTGILAGIDQYEIFVELDNDAGVVLVPKHAIKYVEPKPKPSA
jgi:sRNA-binding regulator protein Hfq